MTKANADSLQTQTDIPKLGKNLTKELKKYEKLHNESPLVMFCSMDDKKYIKTSMEAAIPHFDKQELSKLLLPLSPSSQRNISPSSMFNLSTPSPRFAAFSQEHDQIDEANIPKNLSFFPQSDNKMKSFSLSPSQIQFISKLLSFFVIFLVYLFVMLQMM